MEYIKKFGYFNFLKIYFLFYKIKQGFINIEAKVIFLGLDNTGKTTLLHILKNNHLIQPTPTFHPTMEEVVIDRVTFSAYDLGGHKQARKLWKDYFPIVNAIIFIIDASDTERIGEANEELQNILLTPEMDKIPVLILGNKIDKETALDEDTLRSYLNLQNLTTGKGKITLKDIRPIEIFMCSIINKMGYGEGFHWLSQYLK